MATFTEFRTNILKRLPNNISENICKVTSTDLDDIFMQAQNYFNVPMENLKFEIVSVDDNSLLFEPKYVVVSYPSQEFSFIDEKTNIIKNIHGEFFVRKGRGTVRLMVTPPEEGGQVVMLNVVLDAILALHLFKNVDRNLIKKIVQEQSSNWVIINTFDYKEEENAVLLIDISKDNMTASVLIKPSGQFGADITAREIITSLKDNNIIFGIQQATIDRLEKKPIYNQWIEVAKGQDAMNGANSTIKIIHEESEASTTKPKTHIPADKNFTVVHEGQVVARKEMFESGKEGKTVLGDMIFADPGKDIVMVGNANVKISEDGLEAKALVDGSVYVRGNRVYVDRLWVIEGDLTLEIGNIKFPGSIIIHGNIGDDFIVDVEGNLAVQGSIGNSQVKVGGNLHVGRGIHGRGGKGNVEVEGCLLAKFIESAKIRVKDTCYIEESIINSYILSFNKVIVIKGKGRISSSVIIAANEIIAKKVGSQLGELSELQVVSLPDEREKLRSIQEQIVKLKAEIETKKNFFGEDVDLKSINHMNPKQKAHIKQILMDLRKDQVEIKRLKTIAAFMKKKLKNTSANVAVYITDSVQMGTKIILNDHTSVLRTDHSLAKFYLKDESIVNATITNVQGLIQANDSSKINIDDKL